MICQICGKEFENGKFLSTHLKFEEHITGKDYYDTYIKKPEEGICIVCGKPTKYINFTRGYTKTCSQECNNSPLSNKGKNISKTKQLYTVQQKEQIKQKRINTCLDKYGVISNLVLANTHSKEARIKASNTHKQHMLDGTIVGQNVKQSWKTRKSKIKQYCVENNCTSVIDLLSKYGQGWLSLDIPRIYVNKQNLVVSNDYLPIIEQYFISNQYSNKSKAEQYIIDHLAYNRQIIHSDRKVLRPKELDIYIPDIKLAIEYNGLYWHSIENGTSKYCHRNKSIACHKLDIRLIHIFEFEDIDEQIYKVNQLILGNDLFEQTFTKNSLLDIPIDEPQIIYSKDNHTLYSA